VEGHPENPEEEHHVALFPDQMPQALAMIALLDNAEEPALLLTEGELLNHMAESTSHIDPLDWPRNYELNNELLLVSKDTA
jgi:hypothetical protein